jgi:hypothetical protein
MLLAGKVSAILDHLTCRNRKWVQNTRLSWYLS